MSFTSDFYINTTFAKIHVDNLSINQIVQSEIKRLGDGCSLNHIDVSDVSSLAHLFHYVGFRKSPDISEWDVSNVKNMEFLFASSRFNGDISLWDTKNVKSMKYMFYNSEFTGDISSWNTENVINMEHMFYNSKFDGNINSWDVSNLLTCAHMFKYNTTFKEKTTDWKLSEKEKENLFNKTIDYA